MREEERVETTTNGPALPGSPSPHSPSQSKRKRRNQEQQQEQKQKAPPTQPTRATTRIHPRTKIKQTKAGDKQEECGTVRSFFFLF
jgi:hemolysin activation/secretion protein